MSDSSGGSGGGGERPQSGGQTGGGPGGGGGRRGRRRNRRSSGRGPGTSPPRTDAAEQAGASAAVPVSGAPASGSTPPQSGPRQTRPPGGPGRQRPSQAQPIRGPFPSQPGQVSARAAGHDDRASDEEPASERFDRPLSGGRTESVAAEPYDDDSPPAESPLRMLEVPSDPQVEIAGEALPFEGAATLPTGLLVQVAHVRLHATGQVAEYEVSGDSVTPGDLVVVETEHGTALGTVTRPVMARKVISTVPSPRSHEGGRNTDGRGPGTNPPQAVVAQAEAATDSAAASAGTNGTGGAGGASHANKGEADADRRPGRLRTLLRRADVGDARVMERNLEREKELLGLAKALVRERRMPMKMFRAHVSHGSPRAIFYFTADERIDFRDLVRELSQRVRLRIELRQVGVRDEAKRTGGIGDCGRELCCTTFLPDFAPVTIKMAKEQNIVLNPARVSGQCGRLKCCLVYEYAQYQEARKHLPRVGHMVSTPEGDARVAEVQTLTGKIRVQLAAGGNQVFLASELRPAAHPHSAGQAAGQGGAQAGAGRSGSRPPDRPDRAGNRQGNVGPGRNQAARPERGPGQTAGSTPPGASSAPQEAAAPISLPVIDDASAPPSDLMTSAVEPTSAQTASAETTSNEPASDE